MIQHTWSRLPMIGMIAIVGCSVTGGALGQTTRTNPSAAATNPTIPSSSSTSPNSPCASSNPTSPCFSARAPKNPCYSAVSPNEPCSTTTTPYVQASPSPEQPASGIFRVFTRDQAKAQIDAKGYSKVTGLRRIPDGTWHGRAEKDGLVRNVIIDIEGSVSEK